MHIQIYHQNAKQVTDLIGGQALEEDEDNLDFFIPDPLNRKSYPSKPEEVIIICVAQKQEYMRFQYPLQMKYAW